jgi:hypothetical protein
MDKFEEDATRAAYANSSIDEIRDAWLRSSRFPKAAQQTELLFQLLNEKLAEAEILRENPAAWSAANTPPEKTKTLSYEEKQKRELARLKRITNDGKTIPFVAPPPLYANQAEYDLAQRTLDGQRPVVSESACPHCTRTSQASDCTGACLDPSFWSARRVSQQELDAIQEQHQINEDRREKRRRKHNGLDFDV